MIYKMTKLSSNENEYVDTNGFREGVLGYAPKQPELGKDFVLFYGKDDSYLIRTTEVKSIQEKDNVLTFKTRNSEYKLEKV